MVSLELSPILFQTRQLITPCTYVTKAKEKKKSKDKAENSCAYAIPNKNKNHGQIKKQPIMHNKPPPFIASFTPSVPLSQKEKEKGKEKI